MERLDAGYRSHTRRVAAREMSDRSPHVFHIITRLLRGGAEAKMIETVRALEAYRFTVGFGAAYDADQRDSLRREGIRTVRFPLIRHYNPVTATPAVISVARHLRRHEYDLVHTHSTEAGIIGRAAAAVAGIPHVIHTVHGVPFSVDRHPLLNRFVLHCERVVATRTDRIVCNADVIAEEYLALGIGNQEQYSTVYSGIDVEKYRSAAPARGLPGDGDRVTMVARLVEGKGLPVLLDAVESLDRDDVAVTVVGDGPLREQFEEEVRERGLGDVVFPIGYREDVHRVLAASDVFVLPSFREGTPRVITEAMATGLPVIATRVGGIPEQVEDGESGFLVPPGDTDALADRLQELLDDDRLRASFGSAGRERAVRFSRERMLKDIAGVYRDVLEG